MPVRGEERGGGELVMKEVAAQTWRECTLAWGRGRHGAELTGAQSLFVPLVVVFPLTQSQRTMGG